jgi:hypothetical protein
VRLARDGEIEMRAAQEREKMRDGDGEMPWVMADGYCLRNAVCVENGRGRIKDEEGKGRNGRIFIFIYFYFLF